VQATGPTLSPGIPSWMSTITTKVLSGLGGLPPERMVLKIHPDWPGSAGAGGRGITIATAGTYDGRA